MLSILRKMHDLLALLAEDKVAQRDRKQRDALREIVGKSALKQKSVMIMDGTHTQADIRRITAVNQGDLSSMVGRLQKANLLVGETKHPQLRIALPQEFFESDA